MYVWKKFELNPPFFQQVLHSNLCGNYGRSTETPDLLSKTVYEGFFLN